MKNISSRPLSSITEDPEDAFTRKFPDSLSAKNDCPQRFFHFYFNDQFATKEVVVACGSASFALLIKGKKWYAAS